MLFRNLPFDYICFNGTPALAKSFDHARSFTQITWAMQAHKNLTELFAIPEDEYDARIRVGFHILVLIVVGLEDATLGALNENFMRKMFSMGEQVIRHLEGAINRRHGQGKAIDFANFREGWEAYGGKRSTSQKEKRHLRHDVVVVSVQAAFAAPIDGRQRILEAMDAVTWCAGDARNVRVINSGRWCMPKVNPKVNRKDDRWEEEMHFYAMKSLQAAAQVLGHRYMRWPVKIRDQVVPGTGTRTGTVLEDWEAIDEDGL
ncbi:hypothetical protein LTR17_013319 [Elasticomyces elasticus]|nr:hypothetical protein LTR17_013319 [Elasticomyces elasticus]